MSTAKDEIARLVQAQPDESSREEIVRELAFHVMVEKGLEDSDARRNVSNEDMARRLKPGRKLGEWLPAMQVRSTSREVDLAADVEGYGEK